MTEQEALDEAAKAAGWRDWKEAHERTWELDGMRAHAKTLMENAALEAKLADVSKALMATAEAAASSAKKAVEAADRIEAQAREIERLKVEVMRQMKWKTEAQNDVDEMAVALDNIANESSDTWAREKARAALKEIEGD